MAPGAFERIKRPKVSAISGLGIDFSRVQPELT
jgi:hypothetical protein